MDSEPGKPARDPGSLLDIVLPFTNNTRQPDDNNHNILQEHYAADLSRERDRLLREKHEMERAELQAQRARIEQAKHETRILAQREETLRFNEKANQLAAEIERIRDDKMREGNRTTYPTRQNPAAHAAPHTFAAQAGQGEVHTHRKLTNAQVGNDGLYFSNVRRKPTEPQRPAASSYNAPRGYRDLPPYEPQAPQNQYYDHRQPPAYASWPQRDGADAANSAHYAAHYGERAHYSELPTRDNADPVTYGDHHGAHQQHPHHQPRQSEPYYAPDYQPYPPRYPLPDPDPVRFGSRDQQPHQQEYDPARVAYQEGQSRNGIHLPQVEDELYDQSPHQAPDQSSGFTIDLDAIMRSILAAWKLISILAIIGAVLAAVYAKSLPNMYQAWAELSLDPRDLKVVDSQLTSSGFGGEAMIANLESQLRIIESSSVLDVVIEEENLWRDPEFIGRSSGLFGITDELFPPSRASSEARDRQLALQKLQDALSISRGNRTFIIAIGVTTEDPEKSARVANAVARAYVNGEIGARSRIARDASQVLEDKLEALRKRVLDAENAVENYKASNGLISSEGKLTTEVQLSRLNEQLANAKIEVVNAQSRMEQAKVTDLTDVISGAVSASLNSSTISSLRIRYSALKTNADKLATKLGPKHPERIAAEAELNSTTNQIRREIKRLINGTTKDFQRATRRQQNLNQQVTSLEAQATGVGASQIELRELERNLETHDRVYKDYLLRSRETGEQEGITTTNTREINPAIPPLEKVSPSRKIFVIVGFIIGGLLGLVLVVLKSMFWQRRENEPQADVPDRSDRAPQYVENDGRYVAPPHQPAYVSPHGAARY